MFVKVGFVMYPSLWNFGCTMLTASEELFIVCLIFEAQQLIGQAQ
jgi:hypothetical protein